MDTELAECVARIDERTIAILDNQEKQTEALAAHEERDRQDFKSVRKDISRVERKQNWILGIGTAIMVAATAVGAFIRGF